MMSFSDTASDSFSRFIPDTHAQVSQRAVSTKQSSH